MLHNMIHLKIHENVVVFLPSTLTLETVLVNKSAQTNSKYHQSAQGPGIHLRVCDIFYVFLNQNICCGYSKEPTTMTMLKLMGKKISTIIRLKCVYLDLCISCPQMRL